MYAAERGDGVLSGGHAPFGLCEYSLRGPIAGRRSLYIRLLSEDHLNQHGNAFNDLLSYEPSVSEFIQRARLSTGSSESSVRFSFSASPVADERRSYLMTLPRPVWATAQPHGSIIWLEDLQTALGHLLGSCHTVGFMPTSRRVWRCSPRGPIAS